MLTTSAALVLALLAQDYNVPGRPRAVPEPAPGDDFFCDDFQESSGTCPSPFTNGGNPQADDWIFSGWDTWFTGLTTWPVGVNGGTGIWDGSDAQTDTRNQCVCVAYHNESAAWEAGMAMRMPIDLANGGRFIECALVNNTDEDPGTGPPPDLSEADCFEMEVTSLVSNDITTLRAATLSAEIPVDNADVVCSSAYSIGGALKLRIYFHDEGMGTINANTGCDSGCVVGESGDGCSTTWSTSTAPSSASNTQTRCGFSSTDNNESYQEWSCADWAP